MNYQRQIVSMVGSELQSAGFSRLRQHTWMRKVDQMATLVNVQIVGTSRYINVSLFLDRLPPPPKFLEQYGAIRFRERQFIDEELVPRSDEDLDTLEDPLGEYRLRVAVPVISRVSAWLCLGDVSRDLSRGVVREAFIHKDARPLLRASRK